MTPAGYKSAEEELKKLKTIDRPNVIKAIAAAKEHGDLSENAEYHAAREQQSFIEGRIGELESRLARAEVIDASTMTGDTIKFGATVTLIDEDTEEKVVYQIVGEFEADVNKGKISITSPVARALIGKGKKQSVEVITPRGSKVYEIVKVAYK